jgi:glycosyltransferase involved in cell wall biosynthesis
VAVLLVAEDGGAGGIGRYCVDLAGAMGARAGVVCLCPVPCAGPESCWLAGQCASRGIHLEAVAMPAKAWRSGLMGLLRVWRRTGRPLLHVNGRRGNAVALVARILNPALRYVTTVHGVLGLHDRRNAVYRLLDLAAGRLASAVVAVSIDTQRRLLRAGSPRTTTHVVTNALAESDMARFREVADRRWAADGNDGPLRIGFLGRLSPEKGTHELIDAARGLHASGGRMTVAIGGDGPDREWMTDAARPLIELGLLRFHGEVRDSACFFGDVDVLVIPSRNEGLPFVLLEAMAAVRGCRIWGRRDQGGRDRPIAQDSRGAPGRRSAVRRPPAPR